jgi:hypothetical protein
MKYDKVWLQDGLHGLSLLILLRDRFGPEADDWLPATVQMEVRDEAGAEVPDANLYRLLTARTIFTTDLFFTAAPEFAYYCTILAREHFSPAHLEPPSCEEIAWGITEALLISPPDDEQKQVFSPDIVGFIGAMLDAEGILNPPDVLRLGQQDRTSVASSLDTHFGDDPELLAAATKVEYDRTADIKKSVRLRMHELMHELAFLPLQRGSNHMPRQILARLTPAVGQQQRAESGLD